MRLLPEEVEARGKEIADLIRRNGEELAQNVETVVDKVSGGGRASLGSGPIAWVNRRGGIELSWGCWVGAGT